MNVFFGNRSIRNTHEEDESLESYLTRKIELVNSLSRLENRLPSVDALVADGTLATTVADFFYRTSILTYLLNAFRFGYQYEKTEQGWVHRLNPSLLRSPTFVNEGEDIISKMTVQQKENLFLALSALSSGVANCEEQSALFCILLWADPHKDIVQVDTFITTLGDKSGKSFDGHKLLIIIDRRGRQHMVDPWEKKYQIVEEEIKDCDAFVQKYSLDLMTHYDVAGTASSFEYFKSLLDGAKRCAEGSPKLARSIVTDDVICDPLISEVHPRKIGVFLRGLTSLLHNENYPDNFRTKYGNLMAGIIRDSENITTLQRKVNTAVEAMRFPPVNTVIKKEEINYGVLTESEIENIAEAEAEVKARARGMCVEHLKTIWALDFCLYYSKALLSALVKMRYLDSGPYTVIDFSRETIIARKPSESPEVLGEFPEFPEELSSLRVELLPSDVSSEQYIQCLSEHKLKLAACLTEISDSKYSGELSRADNGTDERLTTPSFAN